MSTSSKITQCLKELLAENTSPADIARTLCDAGFGIDDVKMAFSEEGFSVSVLNTMGVKTLMVDGESIGWLPAKLFQMDSIEMDEGDGILLIEEITIGVLTIEPYLDSPTFFHA